MADYRNSTEIDQELVRLEAVSSICTLHDANHLSREGKRIRYLQIAGGPETNRQRVFITAGDHAREWAPPEAVLSFVDALLTHYIPRTGRAARVRPVRYPAFEARHSATRMGGNVATDLFPDFIVSRGTVKRVVERLELIILPMTNPDGRDFSIQGLPIRGIPARTSQVSWRKNRAPPPPGSSCLGVDLNRNYDIAWNFTNYYDTNTSSSLDGGSDPVKLSLSIDPCHNLYLGTQREPEVQNVQELLTEEQIQFFISMHSYGRKVLLPWAIEQNGDDPAQNFQNTDWDVGGVFGGRDGIPDPDNLDLISYREYFPNTPPVHLLRQHEFAGDQVQRGISRIAGGDHILEQLSQYQVIQSNRLYSGRVYPGTSRDYAFSLQFRPGGVSPIFSCTFEVGHETEHMWWPDRRFHYPKIERETHAGLFALLDHIATQRFLPLPTGVP